MPTIANRPFILPLLLIAAVTACSTKGSSQNTAAVASPTTNQTAAAKPASTAAAAPAPAVVPVTSSRPVSAKSIVAPDPVKFDDAVDRAGDKLLDDAKRELASGRRSLVIDPLIDANTGSQTVSTVKMGLILEGLLKRKHPDWTIKRLSREALAEKPLLLIGTLTPVNVERAIDTQPDAFRIWLTLIDLQTGRVVSKNLDRATVNSVNPEPLPFFRNSPTWNKDKTVSAYINSCQVNTEIGDPADPEYLARLPAAAVINEAMMAYNADKTQDALRLYTEASKLAEPGDLRVLNGLYLTNWELGKRDAARDAFTKIVDSGIEAKKLPVKMLFRTGTTDFESAEDQNAQYQMWLNAIASETGRSPVCMKVVGHTSRSGSARTNERLSLRRAEAVTKQLEGRNRGLRSRLSSAGAGSREALVGLGTDDFRDALDRRVEFRVVDCM
ncbi:MAG: OmpA family protein [Rhodocyclaceae bacterium]